MSCTTVPETTDVTTPPAAFRMSVRAVASAHNFDASPLSPAFASPVSRCKVNPPTTTSVLALIVVVPVVVELITTLQEPVPPAVVHEFAPTKAAVAPPEFVSENLIVVLFGAFAKPE